MSLEASAPHRIISGTMAAGDRCWQYSQWIHSHGVQRLRSASVAIADIGACQAMALSVARLAVLAQPQGAGCPAAVMPLHPEAVPEFCFIAPCSPISANWTIRPNCDPIARSSRRTPVSTKGGSEALCSALDVDHASSRRE